MGCPNLTAGLQAPCTCTVRLPILGANAEPLPSSGGVGLRAAVERLLGVLDGLGDAVFDLRTEPDLPPVPVLPVAAVLAALGMEDVGEDLDDVFPREAEPFASTTPTPGTPESDDPERDAYEDRLLSARCPYCHARPGRWCKTLPGGNVAHSLHSARDLATR